MANAAIRVDGITYTYGDLVAVDNISFAVGRGEILGFLGPNGAGKSTTIKMLTGQARPKTGSIAVLDKDVTKHHVEVQSRIGVCFEEKNLYLNMSGRENLEFFRAPLRDQGVRARMSYCRKSGLPTAPTTA